MQLEVLETSQNNLDELKFHIILETNRQLFVRSLNSFWVINFNCTRCVVHIVYWAFSLMNWDQKISQLQVNFLAKSLCSHKILCVNYANNIWVIFLKPGWHNTDVWSAQPYTLRITQLWSGQFTRDILCKRRE